MNIDDTRQEGGQNSFPNDDNDDWKSDSDASKSSNDMSTDSNTNTTNIYNNYQPQHIRPNKEHEKHQKQIRDDS